VRRSAVSGGTARVQHRPCESCAVRSFCAAFLHNGDRCVVWCRLALGESVPARSTTLDTRHTATDHRFSARVERELLLYNILFALYIDTLTASMLRRGRERYGRKVRSETDVSRDLGSGAPTSPARSRSTSHELRRLPVHGGGAGGLHPARQLCGRVDLRLLRLGHSIRRRRCGRKVPRRACTEVTRGGLARHSAGEAGLSGERGWACGGGAHLDVLAR